MISSKVAAVSAVKGILSQCSFNLPEVQLLHTWFFFFFFTRILLFSQNSVFNFSFLKNILN